MKVLHVASEVAPLSKVGGLGDVAGSLPKALRKLGIDARIVTPAWPGVLDKANELGSNLVRLPPLLHISLQWHVMSSKIWKTIIDDVPIYILENSDLFENLPIYPEELTGESALPFAFFSFSALDLEQKNRWVPDIIHCHDWPSALVPISLKWHRFYRDKNPRPMTFFTIHNVAHQGIFPFHVLDEWGIDTRSFTIDGLEFYGHVNLLKGALITSDCITTVSSRYGKEILTPEMGYGLDGVLRKEKSKLHCVLNGLDPGWSPVHDPYIPFPFSAENLEGKKHCRSVLLQHLGWKDNMAPIFLSISRLTMQKGYDILLPALDALREIGIRFLFIGSGNPIFTSALYEAADSHPDNFAFKHGFHEEFSHLAYAGSDMLIMPSLFEPCGLTQLIALQYGTVPVVRETGGLADTVRDADDHPDGYGFTFIPYTTEALLKGVRRAINAYRDPFRWDGIVKRGMSKDFSWKVSSQLYQDLYHRTLENKRR